MISIKEMNEKSIQFHHKLYEMSKKAKGPATASPFHIEEELGKALGFEEELTWEIVDHLRGKGWVKVLGGGYIEITPAGIDAMENPPELSSVPPVQPRSKDIDGAEDTVFFRDNVQIDLTTVTLADLFRVLETEIGAQVTDPTEKQTLLHYISEFSQHPIITSILQTPLPDVLQRMRGGGEGTV